MIQATVPAGLAMLFTPWRFDKPLIAAAVVTTVAAVTLWMLFKRRSVSAKSLIPVGALYLVFAGVVLWIRQH
jgi:cation:H+ antiporter